MVGFSGVLPYDKMGGKFSDKVKEIVSKTPMFLHVGDNDHYFDINHVEATLDPIKKLYLKRNGRVSDKFKYIVEKNHTHTLSMVGLGQAINWLTPILEIDDEL